MPNQFVARNGIFAQGDSQITGSLSVTQNIIATSITGSLSGIASTASLAFTASSADNFFVRQNATASNILVNNTLTAQTLVVQTVTSSIVFSSGSNIFGNQLTNVQQFTGSLRATGSGNHFIMGGNLGVGTNAPLYNLHLVRSGSNAFIGIGQGQANGDRQLRLGFGGNGADTWASIQGTRYNVADDVNLVLQPGGGNVGIGTTSPGTRLVVQQSADNVIGFNVTNPTGRAGIFGFSGTFQLDIGSSTNDNIRYGNFAAGSGVLSFFNNGSEATRITSAGLVGINATAPAARLEVSGSSNQVVLLASSPAAANALVVSGSGKVGIGTATPDNTYQGLTIQGSDPSLRLKTTSAGGWTWIEFVNSAGTNNFSLGVSQTNPLFGIKAGAGMDNFSFAMNSSGNVGINAQTPAARLQISGSNTAGLLLINSPASGSILVVSGSGNVGIGTASPSARLSVTGSTVAASFQGSGSAMFTVDGTSGRLFQIDDTLSGSLFSVNTAGGLPVIEAFSNNTVRMGQYGSNVFYISQSKVGVGKENLLNGVLDVSGSFTLTGSFNSIAANAVALAASGGFSKSMVIANSAGIAGADSGSYPVWRCNVPCTASMILGYADSGTTVLVNAQKGASTLVATNLTASSTWASSSVLQNQNFSVGDILSLNLTSFATAPKKVTVQVSFNY